MKNTTTLQSKRSITVLLGVLLRFLIAICTDHARYDYRQLQSDGKEFLRKKPCTSILHKPFYCSRGRNKYGSKAIW